MELDQSSTPVLWTWPGLSTERVDSGAYLKAQLPQLLEVGVQFYFDTSHSATGFKH